MGTVDNMGNGRGGTVNEGIAATETATTSTASNTAAGTAAAAAASLETRAAAPSSSTGTSPEKSKQLNDTASSTHNATNGVVTEAKESQQKGGGDGKTEDRGMKGTATAGANRSSSSSSSSSTGGGGASSAKAAGAAADAMSPQDIRRLMAPHMEFYSYRTLRALPPHLVDTLQAEGCALCLRRDLHLCGTEAALQRAHIAVAKQQQKAAPLKGDAATHPAAAAAAATVASLAHIPGAAALVNASNSIPFIALKCTLNQCRHLVHLSCLIAASKDSEHSPSLLPFHFGSFMRAVPAQSTSDPSDDHANAQKPSDARSFEFDISVHHEISNARVLQIERKASFVVQPRTQKQFVYLSNADANSSSFGITRGQFIFRCTREQQHNRGSSNKPTFVHTCHFDLAAVRDSGASSARLVWIDPATHNILIVGVRRIVTAAGGHNPAAAAESSGASNGSGGGGSRSNQTVKAFVTKKDTGATTSTTSLPADAAGALHAQYAMTYVKYELGETNGVAQPAMVSPLALMPTSIPLSPSGGPVDAPLSPAGFECGVAGTNPPMMELAAGITGTTGMAIGAAGAAYGPPMPGAAGQHGTASGRVDGMATSPHASWFARVGPRKKGTSALPGIPYSSDPLFQPAQATPSTVHAFKATASDAPSAVTAGGPVDASALAAGATDAATVVARDGVAMVMGPDGVPVPYEYDSTAATHGYAISGGVGVAAGADGDGMVPANGNVDMAGAAYAGASGADGYQAFYAAGGDRSGVAGSDGDDTSKWNVTPADAYGIYGVDGFSHATSMERTLDLTLEQTAGAVVRLAKTHQGSRFIQQKLASGDMDFFALFFNEMQSHVADLMVDNFGHFAIEKLIQRATGDQVLVLLQQLAPSIVTVACQKHGSFSVQALLDVINSPTEIFVLVDAMRPEIVRAITHASGHFVVLRMLQRFPYNVTNFIDDALVNQCLLISTDHHGLRVVKAVLALRRPAELTRLFKQISKLTMKLVENQYGNYVIQALLDVAPPNMRTITKVKMEGKFMRLSQQKFSSNVVEKCLKQSSPHWRAIIITELLQQPQVSELLRDRYGNYVLQTALAVANSNQVSEINASISVHLPSLRENVRTKWRRMLKKAMGRA